MIVVQLGPQQRPRGAGCHGKAEGQNGFKLSLLGFEPGECASVLSNTNREWLYADMGILGAGGVSNGIYPTDAPVQVEYLCADSATVYLFVEDDEQLDKAIASFYERSTSKRSYIMTDKPLYQPGETAVVPAGSTFTGWSGGCTGSGSCSVTLTLAMTVTATFTQQSQAPPLTVSVSGKGTVTSTPAGINCGKTCSATYPDGTPVTLTASPGSGFSFTGWGGDCSGTGSCTVGMTGAATVAATFRKAH